MSEFSSSSTTSKKTDHLSTLLLSDLFLFCSFIISHPLYFSYLIFFSPYLFKLLSFLSPLFITTSLLLLALLTFSPNLVNDNSHADHQLSGSKVISTFLYLQTYQAFVERLRSKADLDGAEELFHHFEELEAYKIVFDVEENHPAEVSEVVEADQDCFSSTDHELLVDHKGETSHHQVVGAAGGTGVSQVLNGNLDGNSELVKRSESSSGQELIAEGKTLGGFFLHQKEEFEDLWFQQKEEKEAVVKPTNVKYSKKVEEASMIRSGSKAISQKVNEAKISDDGGGGGEHYYSPKLSSEGLEAENPWSPGNGTGDYSPKVKGKPETLGYSNNLGSFGSMRKEKEWRRTLACKLFEERHNVDGSEGMDMLWETYETDAIKVQAKSKTKKGKKGSIDKYYYDDEEEAEEEENDGQLCCLQALKFSAGKMNLGMGRPNLVKISKALKGIGWLHHVTRHTKKGHH